MSILLIRHGETPLNVARVLQPTDTPLSARGLAQAHALARRLAGMNVRAILASDLPRAWQTAEIIAMTTGAPLEATELLRERNFGDWRGRAYDALPGDPLAMTSTPPGGESAPVFEARVARAFALVAQRGASTAGSLAVVTHGMVIRSLLAGHVCLPDGLGSPTHLGNTCLSVFDARPPHLATLINDTAHLDAAAHDDPHALSGG